MLCRIHDHSIDWLYCHALILIQANNKRTYADGTIILSENFGHLIMSSRTVTTYQWKRTWVVAGDVKYGWLGCIPLALYASVDSWHGSPSPQGGKFSHKYEGRKEVSLKQLRSLASARNPLLWSLYGASVAASIWHTWSVAESTSRLVNEDIPIFSIRVQGFRGLCWIIEASLLLVGNVSRAPERRMLKRDWVCHGFVRERECMLKTSWANGSSARGLQGEHIKSKGK